MIRARPYLLLLLFTLLLLWPLAAGKSLYWGDILLYFDPMLRYGQQALSRGEIPLWNPLVLCGQPYLGNPQMAVFYPASLLLPFVPVWMFLSLMSILHLYLCGAFAYLYLSRRSNSSASALIGALAYMGSACLVSRLQFPPMVQTAAYFPLLLWCIDRCLERPCLARALPVSLVIALTILAAHAQMAYLVLACALLYCLSALRGDWKQTPGKKGRERFQACMLWLGCSALLGLALTAAQVLPALQLLKESPREQLTPYQANRFVLEPAHLWTLLFPRFLGHPASGDYWGGKTAWEPSLFVGWVPLLLAGAAIRFQARRRDARFWGMLALFSLWLAFGRDAGLFLLLFRIVPGLSNFHDPARFLFLTTFAISLLACIGMEGLRENRVWSSRVGKGLLVLGTALPLWWYGQDWNPTTASETLAHRSSLLQQVAQRRRDEGRVYISLHDWMWRRFITDGYSDYGIGLPQGVETVSDYFMPNLQMAYDWEAASGYEPVPIYGPSTLLSLIRAAANRSEPNLSRLLTVAAVGTLITPAGISLPDARIHPVKPPEGKTGLDFWANRDHRASAWIVYRTRQVEGKLRVQAALAAPDFDPAVEAVVSHVQASLPTDQEWAAIVPASIGVQWIRKTPVRAEMTVDCGRRPGYLVYSATAYPGWRAELDGQPTTVYRTNGAVMGLAVPSGKHTVVVSYEPFVYRFGLYLTLLSLGVMTAMGSIVMVLHRGEPHGG